MSRKPIPANAITLSPEQAYKAMLRDDPLVVTGDGGGWLPLSLGGSRAIAGDTPMRYFHFWMYTMLETYGRVKFLQFESWGELYG